MKSRDLSNSGIEQGSIVVGSAEVEAEKVAASGQWGDLVHPIFDRDPERVKDVAHIAVEATEILEGKRAFTSVPDSDQDPAGK